MKNWIELESVGSFINLETKIIVPALMSGEPEDMEWCGVHLDEVDEDWTRGLSVEDAVIVNNLV